MAFMKPEALQRCVARMENWEGRESLFAYHLLKQLTFYVASDLLFGLKEILNKGLRARAIWSLPFNFPGTTFNKGLRARARVVKRLSSLLNLRRREIAEGKAMPDQDLMSWLITTKDDNNKSLTDQEIIDNLIVLMIGGHDTTAVLLTQLVRMLCLNPHVYNIVLQEQTAIRAAKQPNEPLAWEDIKKHGIHTEGWQLFWETSTPHFSGEVFKESNKFDPAHFDNKSPTYTFIPFGGGARLCVGYDFARMQGEIFVHHLISKYKWSMINPNEKIICEPLLVLGEGLPIKLQVRRNWSYYLG
ncbi:hypothetical protein SUGI_0471350 [Cryptomeria japonica]|nr:hypothetical protein SUGI_0471350 [Cryptomeria japonica]